MAWIPMAVAAVGAVVAGVAAHGQAKAQGKIAGANAEIAEDQAAAQANAIREKARRAKGSNLAAIGASGVGMEGSFADALTDSDINSELDAQTSIWNGELEAQSLRNQKRGFKSQGTGALVGGFLNAGSKAISAYGSYKYANAASGADNTGTPTSWATGPNR